MSWKTVKLSDFLQYRDTRYKPDDERITNLKRIDKIDFSGRIIISTTVSRTDMILIKPGDLVISGINVYKGALAVYEGNEDLTATIHYSSYMYDPAQIDINFLKLFLKSPVFLNTLKEQVPGGIKTEIKPKQFLPLLIKIPELAVQREIVSKFALLSSDLTQAQLEINNQLKYVQQLRQAFLREAMQGKLVPQDENDEPASVLLERIKAEKAKLIAAGKLKKEKPMPPIKPEEIPYEIPKNWVWCRLGEITSKIGSGSTPSGSNYSKAGIPFYRSQNIYNTGLVLNDITYISRDTHKKMSGTWVLPNDILLNITGGSLGRSVVIPSNLNEGNVSQHVCIIRPLLIESEFLHKIVLSPLFQDLIFSSTTGAGREGLPKYNLQHFVIPLPPLQTQKCIINKLHDLMRCCSLLEENFKISLQQTTQLLQATLREALTEK